MSCFSFSEVSLLYHESQFVHDINTVVNVTAVLGYLSAPEGNNTCLKSRIGEKCLQCLAKENILLRLSWVAVSSWGGKKKKRLELQSFLCTSAITVSAASRPEVFCASASFWSLTKTGIAFNLPEQLCCFFLFISSFNWLTSAKSFSTDRSLASTLEHIFCKESSIWWN